MAVIDRSSVAGEGVDRVLVESAWRHRLKWLILSALVLAFLIFLLSTIPSKDVVRVDRENLTIATVTRRSLEESISTTGTIVPRQQVLLDLSHSGTVREIAVAVGDRVQAGDVLVRLRNTELELGAVNARAQHLMQLNNLRDKRSRLRSEEMEARQEVLALEHDAEKLSVRVERNRKLLDAGLLSEQEFEELANELQFTHRRLELTREAQMTESEMRGEMVQRLEQTARAIDENLSAIQESLDQLVVRAPVSGQLTALEGEVGEFLVAGSRLGQIDQIDGGFRLVARVDEFYSGSVRIGQSASATPTGEAELLLRVVSIEPEIREGVIEVSLDFVSSPHPTLRRGQSLGVRIAIGEPGVALVLPRGSFQEVTGGHWVMVVEEGGEAHRRPVRLGRRGALTIEVIEGLEEGEEVIISTYEAFAKARHLTLE